MEQPGVGPQTAQEAVQETHKLHTRFTLKHPKIDNEQATKSVNTGTREW
jgi:hypothetical protein